MYVSDVMTRALRTAAPDTSLSDIAAVMCLNRVSGLPVVDDSDRLLGFVAERDILHRMFPRIEEMMESSALTDFEQMEGQYSSVMDLKVKDVMTNGVISVTPEMPILKAISVMVRHKFRRIPVARDDILLGIISIGDVHKALFKQNMTMAH